MAMVLYVGIVLFIDIEKVSKIALKIDYWTVLTILTPMTMAIFLLAYRFHRLLQALNVVSVAVVRASYWLFETFLRTDFNAISGSKAALIGSKK
jgi:hypothetical protein